MPIHRPQTATHDASPAPLQSPSHLSTWRWSDLRYLLILVAPVAVLDGALSSPSSLVWWALGIYGAVVVLEAVLPVARHSPAPVVPGSPYFSTLVRMYGPLQWAMQLGACWVAWHSGVSVALGLALCCGLVAGVMGNAVAHELGHSPHKGDRAMAWILMTSVTYGQFMVEHYRGHHPRAGTRADPATACVTEGLWMFLLRKVPDSFMDAWRLEARRLYQMRRPWVYSPLAWSWTCSAVIVLALVTSMALPVLLFWLVQSAIAVWFVEALNYIEHYGLVRGLRAAWMEPFDARHAWNADHVLSGTLFLNLQRHSDHHLQPWKPFASLENLPDAPVLPTGFAGCLLMAAVPPWWRSVMASRLNRLDLREPKDTIATVPDRLRHAE